MSIFDKLKSTAQQSVNTEFQSNTMDFLCKSPKQALIPPSKPLRLPCALFAPTLRTEMWERKCLTGYAAPVR